MALRYLLLAVGLLHLTAAQVLPFLVTGYLESVSSNSGSAINRGGSVVVGGHDIKIPDNLLVEFPALMVPFAQFADAGSGGRAPVVNEVSIVGNIVNDVIIAGQFSISQLDLAGSSGVIQSLGFDGSIKIKNGPTIRINDPRGKFSAGYTSLPFFTADDENPSISAFSGFPMCVPRSASDDLCPSSNRLAGTSFTVPRALEMVPMKVGDYVEYAGVKVGNGDIVCSTIVVNIGLQTSGSQPGYLRVEDALIGIADSGANVEAARYRFVGLASRSDLPVTIWAIDQDPCTGEESDRLLATAVVEVSARNKWKVDIPRGTDVGLYTRNYRVRIGDEVTTTSGIRAGQYVQPVSEWIFPELITPGGAPPPFDFSNIGPLRDGFGPIDGTVFKQLSPWPGGSAPAPRIPNCPTAPTTTSSSSSSSVAPTSTPAPVAIVASAGTDQAVLSGVFVTLSASQLTSGVSNSDLTFAWSQVAGTPLAITGSSTAATLNLAPPVVAVGSTVSREFRVVITHTPSGSTSNDTVVVTVDRASNHFDAKVIDSLTWASKQSGTAAAFARTDLIDPAGSMRIIFGNGAEQNMVRTSVSNGKALYSFSGRSIPRYTIATVRSYINNVLVVGPVVNSTNVGAG